MSVPFDSAVSDTEESVSESAEPHCEQDYGEPCAISAQFFDQYAQRARAYSMSLIRSWADAEEVTQEAFCRLIQNGLIANVESESAARAMLFTTVRNLTIDRLRTRSKRNIEPFDEQTIAVDKSGLSDPGLEQLTDVIDKLLLEMPEEWSQALRLKVNAKLNYEEIGGIMNATRGQIRMWIFRARKKLRQELDKSGLLEN